MAGSTPCEKGPPRRKLCGAECRTRPGLFCVKDAGHPDKNNHRFMSWDAQDSAQWDGDD